MPRELHSSRPYHKWHINVFIAAGATGLLTKLYAMKFLSNLRSFCGADIGDMQVHYALRYNFAVNALNC